MNQVLLIGNVVSFGTTYTENGQVKWHNIGVRVNDDEEDSCFDVMLWNSDAFTKEKFLNKYVGVKGGLVKEDGELKILATRISVLDMKENECDELQVS